MIHGMIKCFTPIVSQVNKFIDQTPKLTLCNSIYHSHSMPELRKKVNVIFVLGPPGSGKNNRHSEKLKPYQSFTSPLHPITMTFLFF